MSLYYLILWNQVDILQKHFKKDHVHMRLWTRLYGIPSWVQESADQCNITELSQIEHRRILGRRAINFDCPRHSSAVLLICNFANSRTYGEAWDRGLCTHESRDHLEERWLAAWLSRSWFCTDDKSAKTCSRFCHRRKDAGGRECADRFSYQITVPESVRRRCESLLI